MALGRVATICDELRRHGLPDTTPAALIAHGTTREQEILNGTIATLADTAAERRPGPPALLIVGEVAGLHERLRWFHSDGAAASHETSAIGEGRDRLEMTRGWPDSPPPC